jgi:hypothetical protein
MRWLAALVLALALGVMPVMGCGPASPCGDCSDGNPCTIDECVFVWFYIFGSGPTGYQCDHDPVRDGTPCGSGCGSGNVCVSGVCGENPCAGCVDDGNQCTDYCDYETGVCNVPRRGDSCRGEAHDGRCSADGVCVVCEEFDCDDGDLCTRDRCSDSSGCVNEPLDCWDGEDRCAECDPETGECIDALAEGNHCVANRELGIDGEYLLGFCESGRCTGQPCDVVSEEIYACPVKDATDSMEPWDVSWLERAICCPWSTDVSYPRGYCTTHGNCMAARCLVVCPEHYATCRFEQNGVCPGE